MIPPVTKRNLVSYSFSWGSALAALAAATENWGKQQPIPVITIDTSTTANNYISWYCNDSVILAVSLSPTTTILRNSPYCIEEPEMRDLLAQQLRKWSVGSHDYWWLQVTNNGQIELVGWSTIGPLRTKP